MRVKGVLHLIKGTFKEFLEDKAMRLAAALAYYAIFSIGPLLFVLVAIAGWIFGEEAVRGQIQGQIAGLVGQEAARTIESMMAAKKLGTSPVTTVLAVISLAIGASGVFGQLQDALNTIWEVKAKPTHGIWGFLRNRFLSFGMVAGVCFLLLVSLTLESLLKGFSHYVQSVLPGGIVVAMSVYLIFDFAVIVFLF